MRTDTELQRLETMATLVAGHNENVQMRQGVPDWRTAGWEFYRAIWAECAELMDHIGWKWWKLQDYDEIQARLEVTDIWIFGLSDMLSRGNSAQDLDDQGVVETLRLCQGVPPDVDTGTLLTVVEHLAKETLQAKAFQVRHFANLMLALPLSYEELYRLTVGKTVLNHFRQDYGYTSGEYTKLWNGLEDNEVLERALEAVSDGGDEGFAVRLYNELATRYCTATGAEARPLPSDSPLHLVA